MGNEYGWNKCRDYSDNALNAFRLWCERKYGTIGALNQAWGTTFWGQEMNSFDGAHSAVHGCRFHGQPRSKA